MKYDFTTMIKRYDAGSLKWRELIDCGVDPESDIMPLSNAEMEFMNPPELVLGLKDFLDTAVMAYFQPVQSYWDAVCGWFGRRFGWEVKREWIMPFPGVHASLVMIAETLTRAGSNIIVMDPTWPGFFDAIEGRGRHILRNELTLDEETLSYGIDFDQLERMAALPNTDALFFCSPQNPVGRVWTREELLRVAQLCLRNNVLIVSDELHADLVMPGYRHIPMASLSREISLHTVTCTSPSKTFNTAGLYASNIITENPEYLDRLAEHKTSLGIFRPSMLSMKAVELCYTRCDRWHEECLAVIDDNRRAAQDFLSENEPRIRCSRLEGSYLMWLDLRFLGLEPTVMETRLKAEARVFIDDGYYFGTTGAGFIRLNLACPKSAMLQTLARLCAWIKQQAFTDYGTVGKNNGK